MKSEPKNWCSTFKWQVGDFERGDLQMTDSRAWSCCFEQSKTLSLHVYPTNRIWLSFGFCQTTSATAVCNYFCQTDGV